MQNLVFLDELIENLFEVTRSLYKSAESKDAPTKEMVEDWLKMAKRASMTARKRIFVVMQAQSQGWGFAKTLNFYQEGMINIFVFGAYLIQFLIGGEADKNWLKAMKKHNKIHETRGPYPNRGRGYRGRGRGGYHSNVSSGYSGQYQQPQAAVAFQPPVQFSYPPPTAALGAPTGVNRSFNYKSQMRCNNCGEHGHYARECPKPALPSMPK